MAQAYPQSRGTTTVSRWFSRPPTGYVLALAFVASAIAVTVWQREPIGLSPLMLAAWAVALSALLAGFGPGLLAGVSTVVAATFFLFPPARGLDDLSRDEQLQLAVFLLASIGVSAVTGRVRRERRGSRAAASEQKSPEIALRESEGKVRDLVDDAPVVLWLGGPDGRVVYRSTRWYDYTGQTAETAVESGWIDAVHPDDRESVQRRVRDAIARGEPFRVEYRLRGRDGTYRWFLDASEPSRGTDGRLLGYIGSVVDITERYEAEQALRKSEERLRLAQTATGLGIWDWDLVADESVCSPEWFRLHGLPIGTERRMGRAEFFELLHPEDREHVATALARALEPGQPFFEYRVVWPDESVHWLASRARLFHDENGRPLRVLGITFEVTARRQVAEQLRQVQRAESVRRLAGGVAHEVNNQMTVVLGLCDFLIEGRALPEAARADVEGVRRAAERSAQIAGQMLAFSRQQVLQREAMDLNDLLRAEEPLLRRVLDEAIRLSLVLAPTPVRVNVDRVQIAQVLLNLVMNARDAMPSGGTITIESETVELDESTARQFGLPEPGAAEGGTQARRRFARLSVVDSGRGMSPETRARVFDPFFTTKTVGQGTGLGLPTAYGIVKQHDGHISVESELGLGSTFRVYLPLAEQGREAASGKSAPVEHRSVTVLVVDDDQAVGRVVSRALELDGFVTVSATNGREALQLLDRHEGPIDLVVTDLVMPEMDGRELIRILRERRPGLPIVSMSGYTDAASLSPGVLEYGSGFLAKPFTPEQLVAKVREVLASRARP